MKTYLLYGFLLAIAGFLLRLVLFLAGLEGDADHLRAASLIGGLGSLALAIVILVLGIRARRQDRPENDEFTYGQAFGAGFAIQLVTSLLSVVTTYVYLAFINPRFIDVVVEGRLAKLQERGMSGDQLDRAEHMIRLFAGPGVQAVSGFFVSLIFGLIIVAIAAAFLRRPASLEPPAL